MFQILAGYVVGTGIVTAISVLSAVADSMVRRRKAAAISGISVVG
jgi:hypothetical protein